MNQLRHNAAFSMDTVVLNHQVAVVTGGGRGLGQAYALALATSGAKVAVIARSFQQLEDTVNAIQTLGGQAIAIPADVTEPKTCEQAIAQIQDQLGPIDLLINNAGVFTPIGPLWQTSPQDWWQTLEVNLKGSFLYSHAILSSMVARQQGRIINVVSEAGLLGIPYCSSYGVSKTALIRLSETLALEAATHNVYIFALDPGAVRTTMTDIRHSPEAQQWIPWCNQAFGQNQDVSLQRVADVILRLASGQYDALSGRYLHATDDLAALLQKSSEIQNQQAYVLRLGRLDLPLVSTTPIDELLQQAIAVEPQDIDQAQQLYHRILTAQPHHQDVLYRLGHLAQRQGQPKEAMQWWQRLLNVNSHSLKAWFSLGNLYQAEGDLQAAEMAYRQALVLQPQQGVLYNNLGYVLHQQTRLDEAIVCYQTALKLQPTSVETEANLGHTLQAQGELSSEQQAYYGALNYRLGVHRHQRGDKATAEVYYRRAIALDPTVIDFYLSLGQLLQEQCKLDEAILSLEKALVLLGAQSQAQTQVQAPTQPQPQKPQIQSEQRQTQEIKTYFKLGQLYQYQRQLKNAVVMYRQGLILANPHYAQAIAAQPAHASELVTDVPTTPSISLGEVRVGDYLFPAIPAVQDLETSRPFWSVVIPVYRRTDYVLEAIASVLRQWPGPAAMEILVMDNASDPPLFEWVNQLGQGIIRYYRNSQNVGVVNNSNLGIALSRGQWIHVLHDDDCVLPGFYQNLQASLESCPDSVGVACTGFEYFDEMGNALETGEVSSIYGSNRGIMQDWLARIGVCGLVTIPAMVVRRATHEHLGGYYPALPEIADWEIFKRYASFYDWWYEPGILARYREHTRKMTPENWRTGTIAESIRLAIEVSDSYFPEAQRQAISLSARRHNFNYCLSRLSIPLEMGNQAGALRILREVLKIDQSTAAIAKLLTWLKEKQAEPIRELIFSQLFSLNSETEKSSRVELSQNPLLSCAANQSTFSSSSQSITIGNTQFPAIPPLPTIAVERPFWSVIIPVYNRIDYLSECLNSVLSQDPGADRMEILVMDDASLELSETIHALVSSLGKGRVRYFRNAQRQGLPGNWNCGLLHSRGQWIHVLHDDDYVLPGFYNHLQKSLEDAPVSVGAAFTGYENIDEAGKTIFTRSYGDSQGIVQNWLQTIGVSNPLNMPAVVIRRSVHEQLGGYHPQLTYTSDWELYKRIASFYDWWHEPGILARYREHRQSKTSELFLSGAQVDSIRQAIEISTGYLPAECNEYVTEKSRQYYVAYCLKLASIPLQAGMTENAWRLVQETFKIDQSPTSVSRFFDWLTQTDQSLIQSEFLPRLIDLELDKGRLQ